MFKNITLELTYRCNLNCDFCYLGHSGRLNKPRRELATAEIFSLIGRFGAGAHFYLSGGEPFLRADIFDIIARIKKAGSHFGVNTNGTLLVPAKAERLAALGPDYVIFSLHGSEAAHDRLTGKKGAWRGLMRNLKAFAAAARPGTDIIVNCVVNRENAGELAEVYKAAAGAGARRVVFEYLQFLRPGEAAGTPARLRAGGIITPVLKDYGADAALINAQFGAILRLKKRPAHFETRPLMSESGLDLYYNGEIRPVGPCGKALTTLNVEPDGRIRLCALYGLEAGDALKTDFAKVLAFKKKNISAGLPGACARCCQRLEIFRHF